MLDLVPNIHQQSQIIIFYDILSDAIQPKTKKNHHYCIKNELFNSTAALKSSQNMSLPLADASKWCMQ